MSFNITLGRAKQKKNKKKKTGSRAVVFFQTMKKIPYFSINPSTEVISGLSSFET